MLAIFKPQLAGAATTPVEPIYPASMASGTIPTIHITTANRDSILDKVTKIPATLYVEVPENSDLQPLGSSENPIDLTIRGRGNATWKLPKKPYKLKFSQKTEILGLPAHRDFALIAWNFGNGNIEWITSICVMQLGRMLGEPWTPRIQPVELILNDNYEGLYFLTESIKIDSERLDIHKQPKWNEDPETIPYGWLVEFDNYADEPQIIIPETDKIRLRITAKNPDEISDAQRQWLTEEFTSLNEAVYSNGLIDWTERIDLESAVRYFIVREITFDTDGYNGSLYLHRDLPPNDKWHFGPLWDIGMGVALKDDFTMNLLPSYAAAHWERQLLRHPAFHKQFLETWNKFYPDEFNRLEQMALEVAEYCEAADAANARRWPEMSVASSAKTKADIFFSRISRYARWLDDNKYWETQTSIHPNDTTGPAQNSDIHDLQGRRITSPTRPGIYIRDNRKILIR